jgi:hypothetical protein
MRSADDALPRLPTAIGAVRGPRFSDGLETPREDGRSSVAKAELRLGRSERRPRRNNATPDRESGSAPCFGTGQRHRVIGCSPGSTTPSGAALVTRAQTEARRLRADGLPPARPTTVLRDSTGTVPTESSHTVKVRRGRLPPLPPKREPTMAMVHEGQQTWRQASQAHGGPRERPTTRSHDGAQRTSLW